MTVPTCATCGASFTPPEQLTRRFPGWQPRECPACYRRRSGRSSGRRGGTRTRRESAPTAADVLDHHESGPDTGVFTDGSASPNPGPGGWGAVYVVGDEIVAEAHGHEPHTTNNRMELTALLRGLDLVPEGTPVTVHSDSNLAVRTINEWAAGWAARGWRRRSGPVENLDLVRPLYERLQERPEIRVVWIRAHAGHRWNEYADRLASTYLRDTP